MEVVQVVWNVMGWREMGGRARGHGVWFREREGVVDVSGVGAWVWVVTV